MQPDISFNDTILEAVGQEQEDVETTVVVTKRYDPLPLRDEALDPSPSLAMQNLAFMEQEVSTVKQELAHLSKDENLLCRDHDDDWKC